MVDKKRMWVYNTAAFSGLGPRSDARLFVFQVTNDTRAAQSGGKNPTVGDLRRKDR